MYIHLCLVWTRTDCLRVVLNLIKVSFMLERSRVARSVPIGCASVALHCLSLPLDWLAIAAMAVAVTSLWSSDGLMVPEWATAGRQHWDDSRKCYKRGSPPTASSFETASDDWVGRWLSSVGRSVVRSGGWVGCSAICWSERRKLRWTTMPREDEAWVSRNSRFLLCVCLSLA